MAHGVENLKIGVVFVQESSQEGTALNDCSHNHIYSSPSSSLESSGSEYKPQTVRKSQKKKVNRRGKCDGRAKCKAKTCEFHVRNVVSVLFAYRLCAKSNWSLH
jgi:hypothetical protein